MSRENLDGSRTPDVRSDTDSFPDEAPASSSRSPVVSNDGLYFPHHGAPLGVSALDVSALRAVASDNPSNDVCFCSKTATALYHVFDFARISLVTEALLSRWLHQLFLELDRYDRSPSMEVRETWLGYPIIGMAASLSLIAKVLNKIYSTEKYLAAEDYVAALFRSAQFYFILDLWSGAESMPLGAFIATSAIALPLLIGFFTQHVLPDSDDKIRFRDADFNYISTERVSTGSGAERTFNLLDGLHYGTASLATFLWMVNREVQGKTIELPAWQFGLMGAGMLCAAKVGYDLTEQPKLFQQFVMGSKFLKEGALAYAAASGIFYMVRRDDSSCSYEAVRILLSLTCAAIALSVALYSSVTARFRFNENCERIEKIISSIRNAPETVANGLAAVGNHTARFFTSCCNKENAETVERTDTLESSLL